MSQQSKRQNVDEYIAAINIEKEQNYINTFVKGLYVIPLGKVNEKKEYSCVFSTVKYPISQLCNKHNSDNVIDIRLFKYPIICELYIPTRDKTIYVLIEEPTRIYNIFSNNFSLDNIIDQNIGFNYPENVNIKIDSNSIKFKNYPEDKHFVYESTIQRLASNRLHLGSGFYLDTNYDLFNLNLIFEDTDKFISEMFKEYKPPKDIMSKQAAIENNVQLNLEQFNEKITEYIINRNYIDARITKCTVDNKIRIFVEAENIIHNKSLEFVFEKPSPNNESNKFINFIHEIGVNSISELEEHPILLCRNSSYDWSSSDSGWYIEPQKSMLESIKFKFKSKYSKIRNID